jgi:transcriptional regulator with XRE-family HTH domain
MHESPSQRLKAERKLLKLTQQDAALACGVARETWSRYESGEMTPGLEVLAAFGRRGANVGWIVLGQGDRPAHDPLSPDEQVLIAHWRAASKPVRNAALAVLLSDGSAARAPVHQKFAGPVGHVTEGDSHISGGRFVVHDHTKPYGSASKARAAKPPKKP